MVYRSSRGAGKAAELPDAGTLDELYEDALTATPALPIPAEAVEYRKAARRSARRPRPRRLPPGRAHGAPQDPRQGHGEDADGHRRDALTNGR